MTITSITELTTPRSADALATSLLATLAAAGFPVTAWQSGNAGRSLVRADAVALARSETLVADLALGAYGATAKGDWLDLFMVSRFDLTRFEATYAKGQVRLTVAVGAGPFNVAPGGLLVSDGTLRWRSTNTGNVAISAANVTTFTVRAELAGTGGNAASDTITRILSPALPGVTCNNPNVGITSTWLTSSAIDREGDAAYLARGIARWATLGSGFSREAVRYWCTSALLAGVSAGCTRVSFAPVPADGSYTVYVAGASGVLGAPAVAAIQAELELHCPITDRPTVVAASASTITVAGTVRFKSASTGAEQIAVTAAIRAYVNGLAMPDDGETTTVDLAGIDAAIYAAAPGRIADVDLSSPTGDTSVTLGSVAVADTTGVSFTV